MTPGTLTAVAVGVLGPLRVQPADGDEGAPEIPVGGARLRALLTRLALDTTGPVSAAKLVAALWGEDPPADSSNALQSLVSRLRRALDDPRAVVQSAAGYRLGAGITVDLQRAAALHGQGRAALRAGAFTDAVELLGEALALWRGEPLADAGDAEYAEPERVRLRERHVEMAGDHAEAMLAVGRGAEITGHLAALVREHPLQERFTELLMTALADSGRPAEALRAYEKLRALLAEELGADPSPAVRELHVRVLRAGHQPRGLTATAVPLRRTNLPAPLTTFVGREDEIARLLGLLDTHRLVTVVGTGGAGKTRLAGEVGRRLPTHDTWLVELASVTDPRALPVVALDALGIREPIGRSLTDRAVADAMTRLREAMAERPTLLVLDNCEHLVDAAASLAEELLVRCPKLRVLATSREPLAIAGECLHDLAALPQPPAGTEPAVALHFAAVALFVARARALVGDFTLDATNVAAVVEIVTRLDGLPLAIELAAARLRTMPVSAVASGLSDRFRLLTGGSRTALPRHRTLRAVVAWSWELLTPEEKLLAERFAVFPAGATVHAAQAVCGDGDALRAGDVPGVLAALVDRSLLALVESSEVRYRMLETIREYGIERLAERGELAAIRTRHARHFAAVVTAAREHFHDPLQVRSFRVLEVERDSTLAALGGLIDDGAKQDALAMALDLAWFWMIKGNHAEVSPWIRAVLAMPGEVDRLDRMLAEALVGMHVVFADPGDNSAADGDAQLAALHRLSVELDDIDVSDKPLLAMSLPLLAWFGNRLDMVDPLVERAIGTGNPWVHASALVARAAFAENGGDLSTVAADLESALHLFRSIGDQWGVSGALAISARLLTVRGDLDGAMAAYTEALVLFEQFADSGDHLELRVRLADVHARRGDLSAARLEATAAVDIAMLGGGLHERGWAFIMQAEIELAAGDIEAATAAAREAARLLAPMVDAHPRGRHVLAWVQALTIRLGLARGDLDAARRALRNAYDTARGTEDSPIMAMSAVTVAMVLAAEGRAVDATRTLGAADRIRGSAESTDLQVRAVTDGLRASLGDKAFDAAYDEGRRLCRDDALRQLGTVTA